MSLSDRPSHTQNGTSGHTSNRLHSLLFLIRVLCIPRGIVEEVQAEMNVSGHALLTALGRARAPILWIGSTYLLSVIVGAGMVHAHNGVALRYRDKLVRNAQQSTVVEAMNHGMHLRAAVGDFTGNLFLGAVPSTIMGLSVIMPFPWVAFRGWVGGIVSV